MPVINWAPQFLWIRLGREICRHYQKNMSEDIYMLLDEEDSVIHCFRELGEKQIPQDLNNGQLPKQVEPLEKFVCSVYSQKGPTTLPSLRWQLFQLKNLEAEMLPPTRASLLPRLFEQTTLL